MMEMRLEWCKKSPERSIRSSMYLFESSAQCESKWDWLSQTQMTGCQYCIVTPSIAGTHRLLPHVKLQLPLATGYTRRSWHTSGLRAGLHPEQEWNSHHCPEYKAWLSRELSQKFREMASKQRAIKRTIFFSQLWGLSAFFTRDTEVTSAHYSGKTMPETSQ